MHCLRCVATVCTGGGSYCKEHEGYLSEFAAGASCERACTGAPTTNSRSVRRGDEVQSRRLQFPVRSHGILRPTHHLWRGEQSDNLLRLNQICSTCKFSHYASTGQVTLEDGKYSVRRSYIPMKPGLGGPIAPLSWVKQDPDCANGAHSWSAALSVPLLEPNRARMCVCVCVCLKG